MKIVGYCDRWSGSAGDELRFFVSCAEPEYSVELRRLIHGDTHPAGPGVKEEVIEHPINRRSFKGEQQKIHAGSCMRVVNPPAATSIVVTGAFQATRLIDAPQTVASLATSDGRLFAATLRSGGLALEEYDRSRDELILVQSSEAATVEIGRWRAFKLDLDLDVGVVTLDWRSTAYDPTRDRQSLALQVAVVKDATLSELCFAAIRADRAELQWRVAHAFNGRIADLQLYTGGDATRDISAAWSGRRECGRVPTAAWDFARAAGEETVPDVVSGKAPGQTLNRPTRLVAGPNFAGQARSATEAPHLFNAAHFHDDDLSDAGWSQSFSFTPPSDLRSGVYAFRLICEGGEDCIPFFVTPQPGKESAPLGVLMPTLSYHVYANMGFDVGPHIAAWSPAFIPLVDQASPETQEEAYTRENRLLSCYDLHSDGSGVCMASTLRPLVKYVRPDSRSRINDSAHHLSADLSLIDWLHEKGIAYEIITDHDLHARGQDALAPYHAIVTGTHSEYWTSEMLDALKGYTDDGGRFILLSGNSLYWVTALSADGTLCEVRRNNGVRAWVAQAWEAELSLTGTRGGLWRDLGRPAQRYVGTGFVAQGFDFGRPYTRLDASYTSRAAVLFEGIDEKEIGDFPALQSGYGAAGLEFDRADAKLGTPEHAVILARATGFSDSFQIDVAEAQLVTPFCGGTHSPDVYSDMVFFEMPNGGAVFSAPSISWSSTLSHNGYDNSVSKLTENVIRRFQRPGPLDLARDVAP